MGQENANDQPPPPPPTVWQKLAERIRNTPGSGLAFAVIPLLILGYVGWYYYGAEHLDRTLYSLKLENIELTPQPAWIRGDLKAKVFHSNQLSKVSLLDPAATATIAHAFDAHMWIKSTNHVRKLSGGKVVVDVTYRRPGAMVHCDQVRVANGKGAYFPVDEEGLVLDGSEFNSTEYRNYFMIFAPSALPAGKTGMAFGDPRITEALSLCKLLDNLRGPLKLACIYVEPDSIDLQLGGFNSWVLNITTDEHREIVWGHAPGKETRDEMLVDEKIAALTAWLKTPAAESPIKILDLRQRRGLGQRLTSTPSVISPPPQSIGGSASLSTPASATRPEIPSTVPRPLPPPPSLTQPGTSSDASLRELLPQSPASPRLP